MCGIFGFVTTKKFKQQRMLYSLMASAMNTRGREAYGVYAGSLDGKSTVFRGTEPIISNPEVIGEVSKARVVAGHTRLGTTGRNSLTNTHPFKYNDHLVAHNGMIYNYNEFSDGKSYDVDSQALAWRIAMNRPTKELEGYGAVWWVDPRGALYCARMNRGDLHLITITDVANGARAYGFVSSLTSGVFGTGLGKALDAAGLKVKDHGEPDEGETYRLSTRGFTKKARVVNVSSFSGVHRDWRQGRSGGTHYSTSSDSNNYKKHCMDLNPERWDYHGFMLSEKNVAYIWKLWQTHSTQATWGPNMTIRGNLLVEDLELTLEHGLVGDEIKDITGFRSSTSEYICKDDAVEDFAKRYTNSPWDLLNETYPDAIADIDVDVERLRFELTVNDPRQFLMCWRNTIPVKTGKSILPANVRDDFVARRMVKVFRGLGLMGKNETAIERAQRDTKPELVIVN